jgi:hypothetical protein
MGAMRREWKGQLTFSIVALLTPYLKTGARMKTKSAGKLRDDVLKLAEFHSAAHTREAATENNLFGRIYVRDIHNVLREALVDLVNNLTSSGFSDRHRRCHRNRNNPDAVAHLFSAISLEKYGCKVSEVQWSEQRNAPQIEWHHQM